MATKRSKRSRSLVAENDPGPFGYTASNSEEETTRTVKRKDVAERTARNKTIDFFVMKQTLKRFCKKEAEGIEWDDCLKNVNQAVAEAYLLANFYVLRQLKASRPICKIDHVFYQTCLSLVTKKTRSSDEQSDDLKSAGYEFMQLRGEWSVANTKYLNQGWFQAAAKQMATNARNAVVRNFVKRLRSYIIDFYDLKKNDAYAVVNGIFAKSFKSVPVRVLDPIVMKFRSEIPSTVDNKISWEPHDLLPLFYRFLQYIEEQNEENKDDKKYRVKRTFSLLPTKRGFEASYCKIDSTGLRALFLRSPKVDRELTIIHNGVVMTLRECLTVDSTTWIGMADQWWRRLFHVDKLERANKRSFHREITTDGYGVGVHMNRPTRGKVDKRENKKAKKNEDESMSDALGIPLSKTPKGRTQDYDVIWGIDPGRTDFITAINQEGKMVRFRTSDFRRASGFSRSSRKSKRRIDKSRHVRELLQETPTKKTASMDKLIEAILFTFEHANELLTFFLDPFFRKLKFRRYTLRTAQLDRACFELAGSTGTKTIIGFGDSGTAGEGMIKSSPAGPVKAFVRKLARYCEVVVVDEYKTSKVHHDCSGAENLENQRVKRMCKDGKERNVPVHKVLHCLTKNGGCGMTVDRDVNAAKNMLSVLQRQLAGNVDRPFRLQRPRRQ